MSSTTQGHEEPAATPEQKHESLLHKLTHHGDNHQHQVAVDKSTDGTFFRIPTVHSSRPEVEDDSSIPEQRSYTPHNAQAGFQQSTTRNDGSSA